MDQPIVETVEGKLRGCVKKNLDGEEFYSFLGIPYAKSPLGDLRFKPPQPAEPWSGVKDALEEGKPFFQKDNITQNKLGVEDALHLNVFTKKPIPDKSHLNPVMVWIHGGGYVEGRNNTDLYGPDFLLTEDIVLVSINYRIGILGFLSLEDPSLEIYGNMGLKDQVEALRWIQRNIKSFGGDPNNVTIFGESAGGSSVHYLVMSPLAKGLVHKAILQSGVIINYWAKGIRFIKHFMSFLGKENMSDKEILEFLKNLPAEELFDYQEKYFDSLPMRNLGLVGPVEEIPNDTAFITKCSFEEVLSSDYDKIPILLGYNSNECIVMSADSIEHMNKIMDLSGITLISKLLNIQVDDENTKRLEKKLKEVYPNEVDKFLMLSDAMFIMGIITAAKIYAKISDKPVYLYRMSLDAGLNILKRLFKADHIPGACHVDDCGYLFSNGLVPLPEKHTIEYKSVKVFVKLWTNFAKYGNPTPTESELGVIWKPFQVDNEYFLDIDKELTLLTAPENERVRVWKEIFQLNPETAKYL